MDYYKVNFVLPMGNCVYNKNDVNWGEINNEFCS